MPRVIECRGCGFTASVPDEFAGNAAKCKRCGSRMEVPAARPTAAGLAIPELDTADVVFAAIDVGEAGDRRDSGPAGAPKPASTTRARDVGKEPWYYGFLDGYAYLIMVCGVAAGCLWALGLVVGGIAAAGGAGVGGLVESLAVAVPVLATVFGSTLVGASILLAVDAARTLRAIRERP